MIFSEHYQALFYLSTGFSSFLILFLVLRQVGGRGAVVSKAISVPDNWRQKEALKIVEIIPESPDIKSFRFRRVCEKPFPKFKPGQFLSFQIGEDPKCLRSYSISSSSVNGNTLQVSIKHIQNGKGSSWFHQREAGQSVYAFPPSGLFSDDSLETEARIYIAGGIGITPCLSMILSNLDKAKECKMDLFYGARTEKDLAFHRELIQLQARHQNFKYHPILSRREGTWVGAEGHITVQLIQSKTSISGNTRFFLCGPQPMTDSVISDLMKDKISPEFIHNEKFASPVAFDPEKIPTRSAKVNFGGRELKYSGKQTLLEFLEEQGECVPFACRVGVCGTCKARIKGKTETITDAGLSPIDKQKKLVLTCVAFPVEDIQVEIA